MNFYGSVEAVRQQIIISNLEYKLLGLSNDQAGVKHFFKPAWSLDSPGSPFQELSPSPSPLTKF